jgi:hypothetical protein
MPLELTQTRLCDIIIMWGENMPNHHITRRAANLNARLIRQTPPRKLRLEVQGCFSEEGIT